MSAVQKPIAGAPWVLLPPREHTATVVLLHGLGGSGEGWLWLGEELRKKKALGGVKWVLPSAPLRAITANFGQKMPGWYDVRRVDSSDAPRVEDEDGLFETVSNVHALLDKEIQNGIPSERIVLAGFSQGAAVTLAAGLTYSKKLAGIAAMSGYLMCKERVEKEKSAYVPQLPLFLAHGKDDGVVSIQRSVQSVVALEETFGYQLVGYGPDEGEGTLTVKHYDGLGHAVGDEEVEDFRRWLESVLHTKQG
ncbi:acyl-protein thioesterase 1 [Calocera viscosa TUFC12733]|uniref:Acyl-protein thioesterase 1 n=1 Tax=Calocera viscosa (strain TUFC12733) TaxID=1330018 RepID=A0A167NIY1_CALVF|nr:acyl-protein thioesterase 1 [Calocera viscosa TUFC12733]